MDFGLDDMINRLFGGVRARDPPNNAAAPAATDALPKVVLSEIHDLKIDKWETMKNFKKVEQEVKVVQKRKGKKPQRNPEAPPAKSDDENNEEENNNNAENKKKTLPNELRCAAKYDFRTSSIVFCFSDDYWDWSRVSISGMYKSPVKNVVIPEDSFEYKKNDFKYFMNKQKYTQIYIASIANIERSVVAKRFSVKLGYMFLADPNMQHFSTEYFFDVPVFQTETKLKSKFLGHYHADKRIVKLYNTKFMQDHTYSESEKDLLREIDDYWRYGKSSGLTRSTEMVKYALNIEDLASQDELESYTRTNVRLTGRMDYYSFDYPEKDLPENYEEMSICLVPMDKYIPGRINSEDDTIFAQIDGVEKGKIFFEKKFPVPRGNGRLGFVEKRTIPLNIPYFIRFIPNRITYRACFHAFDTLQMRLLSNYFSDFNTEPAIQSDKMLGRVIEFDWYNKAIADNEEQKQAIKNIVNRTAYPFPYVVHGPPGTGKTSLIVETIAQILKANPKAKILVTAQSNSACDEVGERLLKHISINKMYRFYSPSLLNPANGDKSKILMEISNLRNKKNQYPTLEEFKYFNVVIVTLMSCSRIVQFEGVDLNRHFDYIFVDECAAATEPEALVPIVGLATDTQEITANIVLLGDHKQLGPVISSDHASRLGLNVSLMERVLNTKRYRMDPYTMEHNKKYVTQLLDNFRSHPAILQFSNVLFYNSKLRAKLAEPERSLGTKWNYLVNDRFPLLFHCNKTRSEIIKGGTSSFNQGEIDLVKFYVDLLLKVKIGGVKITEEDIGVVSPYKAQLHKLKDTLRHAKGVEIGTAEYYQGREKRIIIISTVKSKDSIGFLKSEKRLNVCITRAKTLLVVIGNADTLQRDKLWNSFMHFCKANNGVCGDEFALRRMTDDEEKVMEELNSIMRHIPSNRREEEDKQRQVQDLDEKLKAIEARMKVIEALSQKVY